MNVTSMARIMQLHFLCIIFMLYIIIPLAITNELEEVCDVEGSGIDECIDMCCEPSKCELKYNPDKNPDKRCCTEEERKLDTLPSDCTPCRICCDESTRKQTSLPEYCSKCPRCEHHPTTAPPPTTEGEYDLIIKRKFYMES